MVTTNASHIRQLHWVPIIFGIVVLCLVAIGAPSQATPARGQDLDTLLSKKQYRQLEQALQAQREELPEQESSYFSGVMANRLNQINESLQRLEPLIPNLVITNPVRGEVALCTVADDYAKIYRYADASRVYTEASRVSKQQNLPPPCEAVREALRWALLSNAPAQTVTSAGQFTIQGRRDVLGLIQVPVSVGGYAGSWILDSGANLSIISRSVADQMRVAISHTTNTANGISAGSVQVHVGVIPEINLGPAVFHNVPVLVVPDSQLDFPQVNYHIEGSLGLPILAALGRVTVYRNGLIRFGGERDAARNPALAHNLFLENFTPVIAADFGLGDQLFTIDTGAVRTILSAAFYHDSGAVNSTEFVELELVGAGGTLVSPAYQLRDVGVRLGGSCTRLEIVDVLTKPIGLADEFYGNIGESTLSSFASFTLDFKIMHFETTGPRVCR